MEGFTSYNRNRQHANMGGVATCISNKEASNALKVAEGVSEDEYIITRHSQFRTPINIVNIYGETESRSTKAEIKDRWDRIVTELAKIELKGESTVIIGDLNKQVGDIIEGNKKEVSFGGNLIKELLDTKEYILVNATSKVKGGPFTRFDPANPEGKSCLDLVIISKDLLKYLHNLTIDKNLTFTPGRPIRKNKITYSDHRSLILEFRNIPLKLNSNNPGTKFSMWNTNRIGGWEVFKMITENNKKLENAVNENTNPTLAMKGIDDELKKAKFKAFGKVKVNKKQKINEDILNLNKKKVETIEKGYPNFEEELATIEKKIAENLLSEQRINFETEIKHLKELKSKKGKSASIFSLKNKIVVKKKLEQEATIIINPANKEIVTEPEEIIKVSLEYCTNLLTNRQPKEDFEEEIKLKNEIHDI